MALTRSGDQIEENPCRAPVAVAHNGQLEAVKLLLTYQVNVDMADYKGLTAVDLAQKLAMRPLHQDTMPSILALLKEYGNNSLPRPTLVEEVGTLQAA